VCCAVVALDLCAEQRRYLYWAFFIFGLLHDHQTLIVPAMGLVVDDCSQWITGWAGTCSSGHHAVHLAA